MVLIPGKSLFLGWQGISAASYLVGDWFAEERVHRRVRSPLSLAVLAMLHFSWVSSLFYFMRAERRISMH